MLNQTEAEQENLTNKNTLTNEKIEAQARVLLGQLTLAQKIKQLSGDGRCFPGVFRMAFASGSRPMPAGKNRSLGIPALAFTDGPRGVVIGRSTCFPVAIARGASWDVELEERIGEAMGREANAQGANCVGAPCVNVLRHPAWGRAQETYGEDPFLLGELGAACVRGIQKHVMACVKHFCLNSIEKSRFRVNVKIDERTLREIYLAQFRRCVDAGAAAVMTAYNRVNGRYCEENTHLLQILKNEWGFQGLVISDFLYGVHDTRAALEAGLDLEMPFAKYFGKRLMHLAKRGEVSPEKIDESVIRILKQKIRFSFAGKESDSCTVIACRAHRELACEAAEKSAVLLKNDPVENRPILPFDRAGVRKIAVLGKLAGVPNTGDDGSSRVHPPYIVTPLDGLKQVRGPQIIHANGRNLRKAADMARTADTVIVVVGYTKDNEGEYLTDMPLYRRGKVGDRISLELSAHDEKLILSAASANPRTVVVMMGGSAIVSEAWRQKIQAILMLWYPGMEGGHALANLLFGDANPSGKLPCVFPKSADQLPAFDREADEIEYGFYHGYRLMEKTGHKPAFAFGFGLSYTTFSVTKVRLDRDLIRPDEAINISLNVKNTGDRPGAQVIQLYAGALKSKYDRPTKVLKGFKKIFLQPGEIRFVSFNLSAKNLAVWDNGCVVEPGDYSVWVGTSSRSEDLLQAWFKVKEC